jgi:pimeloyl-ACP methyl ester carboxylesterase
VTRLDAARRPIRGDRTHPSPEVRALLDFAVLGDYGSAFSPAPRAAVTSSADCHGNDALIRGGAGSATPMTDVTSFDGTRLALREWGSHDAPLVLLVHGLGMSTESWGEVPHLLAGRHRVVAYDLRGHSQSGDARSGGYTLEAHARDLAAVLDAVVPDERRALVVGHSLGGGILVAHVHANGGDDRIAGAVFAASGGSGVTVPGFPAARGLPAWATVSLRSAWFTLLRAAARLGRRIRPMRSLSDRIVRHAAFAPDEPMELVQRVRDSFLTTRPLALAGTTLASVTHDGSALAPALRAPPLIVHGSRDREVPRDDAEKLLSALPDGELYTIDGAGHMLPLTHPELLAGQVDRWAERIGPDRDATGFSGDGRRGTRPILAAPSTTTPTTSTTG